MPSLQLLQLTEHGRSFMASRRKTLLLATGIVVAGGTVAYVQSRLSHKKHDAIGHYNGLNDNEETTEKVVTNDHKLKKPPRKKGGLKSLQVLAAILLSEMGQMGVRDLLALVSIVVLRTALSNRLAKVQGFLFRAAFLRRVPLFLRLISENILLCFLVSTMHSTSKYITGTLSLRFRKILTKLIHSHYFENIAYYKMSHVDGRITNPEQRIASDVPKFCSELSEIVQDDLTAVTDGLLYTWRLCSYASPKYVFWILAYVIGAGATIRNFSPAFGKLMSKEQQLEGEYRQLHSRLRTHAESVAFYGGESREEFHIKKKFETLIGHMRVVLHDHWWFGMIQDFLLKYLGATVAVILIIEPFFSGHLRPDTSTLGRAEMLSNLRYHTSVIISLFQSLGTLSISSRRLNRLSGYADRIHELLAISRELSVVNGKSSGSRNCFSEADYIEFAGVKVVTPTGNVLVDNLSLRVESGSNLLITGPNGSGKSSLFRVLGGLWPLVSGHIVKPGVGTDLNKEIFYVPQRPYTAVGTLRDQLIYPLTVDQEVEPLTHSGMVELLRNVDLEYLLDRYPPEKEINWGDELSLGEQQRLGMARLFYHKPKFAILDECTSAVTTDMEERFCAKVRAMGTSCITISHRPALVAFHDVVLSLDGEGGWSVQFKRIFPYNSREDSPLLNEGGANMMLSETTRQSDALTVQRAFATTRRDSTISNSKAQSYIGEVIAVSPSEDHNVTHPFVPQLRRDPRALPLRVAAMFKVLIPTVLDKQGAQLLAVAFLVVSRTWISDRIASLNGTTVKFVLEQDKAAFIRLIGVSVLQSAASSFIAPSLRHLTARLALGWRIRLTQHLLKNYLRNNAFYKVFNMSSKKIDADQRITQDLEKLTTDLSGLVTGMIKPSVDILWFTWRMKLLTGRRGVAILYAYMLLGLGFLRSVTPEFGDLASREQQLEGTFRFMHERLRAHAESVAFFGGGSREKAMVESKFKELLDHSLSLLKKKWLFGILDDFTTKQLPHNVTWGLSLLYAIEHKGDRALISTQGELAHALRFLASVVSQSFLAFGDILELHRKFLELSGGINRIFELEELLDAAQSVVGYSAASEADTQSPSKWRDYNSEDVITFSEVNIITPSQKILARELTCDIVPGKSLLVTGPNGSGKSSVFRVLRGLWPITSGRITKPSQHVKEGVGSGCGVFYVPQRPYTCLGTLRDQIIYPLSFEEAELRALKLYREGEKSSEHTNILDMRLRTILENVRLSYLLEREEGGWDANLNWEDTLSLGEQQRLGMARLFFHKPKFAILDECTNATSVDVEEQLYRLAKDMGITVVTSSQRPALIPFHALELRLIDGEGNWELRSIKQ
ncbi:ABC transporter D family member 1 isoform X1 [Prunus dulcis]|uniref:ABC transporter D family member 1 isoform X1 n=1 Tax=Prunus dulcis TaxID=3755 RepID=UPI0014835A90|nr:ABC transporter D family member 1 isoform X1 [Prunus dulcis]